MVPIMLKRLKLPLLLFTFCENLVKFSWFCCFFFFNFRNVAVFVFLLCENATPRFLLEMASLGRIFSVCTREFLCEVCDSKSLQIKLLA